MQRNQNKPRLGIGLAVLELALCVEGLSAGGDRAACALDRPPVLQIDLSAGGDLPFLQPRFGLPPAL